MSFLGTMLLIIHSIFYLVKHAKTNLPNCFLHLSLSAMTVFVLCKINYWSCGPMIFGSPLLFIVALLVAIIYFGMLFSRKLPIKLPQLFLGVYFVFFFVLSFVHSYSIYYFFNLEEPLNIKSRNIDYRSWDNYSWFLYIADKQEEALEANKMAKNAAEEYLKVEQDEKAVQYLDLIEKHHQQIQDDNWTSWP